MIDTLFNEKEQKIADRLLKIASGEISPEDKYGQYMCAESAINNYRLLIAAAEHRREAEPTES